MTTAADGADHAVGVFDAEAGVPHPLAESRDDGRQPVARLYGLQAEAIAKLQSARHVAYTGLNEVERLSLVLPAMIERAATLADDLARALRETGQGRERWLARWRMTAIVGALAIGLPAEVYLTALSLNFLDVPDAWAQRFLAVGIAVALALVAIVAASRESKTERLPADLAAGVVAAMLFGLALLRWGVTPNSSWLEEAGALLVMAVAGLAFVLWTAFVKQRVERAVAEHAQWLSWLALEHDARSAQSQHSLLTEMHAGLPAEANRHRDHGVVELRRVHADFLVASAAWWTGYQATNPAASPDVRSQLEELRQDLEGHVLAAAADIDDRATSLRTRTVQEDGRPT